MCGVVGVLGTPESAKEVFLGLITLQHRGQDAAGILSYDDRFHLVKNIGLVESVFQKNHIDMLPGKMAIGHTRYSTVGRGEVHDVQPLLISYPYGIGMVHNGNIVNYLQLKDRLQNEMRRVCLTSSDTETILNWLANFLEKADFHHIKASVKNILENIHGSYSIVSLIGDVGMIAFRDPYGIRPLVLGSKMLDGKKVYMVASETLPLSFLGYELDREIQPGEVLFITKEGELHSKILLQKEFRPCMFEWVYFASAESKVETAPVYSVRLALGRSLAEKVQEKIDQGIIQPDLVAPVPDTSRTAAISLAESLKIPFREVLIKNRYITRTFILGSQSKREKAVDMKLNPVESELKGKRVLLVDDSIVRGTTSRKIIQLVKKAGAKEVYFVSTCPPIRFPCFYGIDFPESSELIGNILKAEEAGDENGQSKEYIQKLETKIAEHLGADAVIYQSLEGLKKSIQSQFQDKVKRDPCSACIDGKYPTDVSEASRFAALRHKERQPRP